MIISRWSCFHHYSITDYLMPLCPCAAGWACRPVSAPWTQPSAENWQSGCIAPHPSCEITLSHVFYTDFQISPPNIPQCSTAAFTACVPCPCWCFLNFSNQPLALKALAQSISGGIETKTNFVKPEYNALPYYNPNKLYI